MPTQRWGRAHPRPSVFCCLLLIVCLLFPRLTLASTHIVIGEISWAGSSRSIADEWIELWNMSEQDQSLEGWTLSGASAQPFTFGSSDIIPAQSVLLIANYAETNTKSVLTVHPAMVATEVSISNDTLELILRDTQGTIIDQAGSHEKPFAGATKPQTSMVRSDASLSGIDPQAWADATQAQNLAVGVEDLATPGICDGCTLDTPAPPLEEPTKEPTTSQPPETVSEIIPDAASSSTQIEPPAASVSSSNPGMDYFVETTTSSADLIDLPKDVSTSTADVNPLLSDLNLRHSTTSTVAAIDEVTTSISSVNTTSTTATASTSTTVQTTSTVQTATASSPSTTSNSSCHLRFETIFPAPSAGPEWIDVSGCGSNVASIIGWSIHDADKLIYTVAAASTIGVVDESILRIALPSGRLRNAGNLLQLRGPDGGLYDTVTYPAMNHDEHYARQSNGTWWIPERDTSSEDEDTEVIAPLPTLMPSPTPTSTVAASSTTTLATVKAKTTLVTSKPVQSKPLAVPAVAKIKTPTKVTVPKAVKAPATKKKAATTSKSSSTTAPRVTLHGVVGTPINIVGSRKFILLNADGRGLLVHTNGLQPSPAFGASIDITGTLITNDQGTRLEMRTADRWQASKELFPIPQTTTLDLLEANLEDIWSLIEVTGKVQSTTKSRITLNLDDTDVTVVIHASLNYRAERLEKGDTVRIRGVVDITRSPAYLYPRAADDITIIQRAQVASTTVPVTKNSLPPWAPIGAAGTTIATGYSIKRWRKWYEQKRLERQLSVSIERLSS